MLNIQGASIPMLPNTKVPRVKGTAEADRYPTQPNTEVVLFDESQEDIMYIKVTAQNGFTRTVRYRCYEEPEPTTEDLLKDEFITKNEFNSFINEFREFRKEMTDAQFSSNNGSNAKSSITNNANSKHNQ